MSRLLRLQTWATQSLYVGEISSLTRIYSWRKSGLSERSQEAGKLISWLLTPSDSAVFCRAPLEPKAPLKMPQSGQEELSAADFVRFFRRLANLRGGIASRKPSARRIHADSDD